MISDPRHRAYHHQLWIDKVRDELDRTYTADEFEQTVKLEALARLLGPRVSREYLMTLPPERLAQAFMMHGLADRMPVVAMNSLKARGYPQRVPTIPDDWPACETAVCGALNWCSFDILRNPDTQVMLLDDRTAKAVARSRNQGITAAELQHLPHNPCLIEFYRPIEIAETVKHGVRLRAVGFEAVGTEEAPAAVVGFYLDYWQAVPQTGTRWPATLGIWFGGFNVVTIDGSARTQIGFEADSITEAGIMEVCKRVGRNLWDFVTSRSINYEAVKRQRHKHPLQGDRPQHIQGLHSKLDREVFFMYLSHDSKAPAEKAAGGHPSLLPYRFEVLGKFHYHVYCAKCGRQHRHDMLGQPCRKCLDIVGPRANVRVEKFWHQPYVIGPEGAPFKEVVRDVHRKKARR